MKRKTTAGVGLVFIIFLTALFQIKIVRADSPNLAPNPSVETVNPSNQNQPLNWFTDQWGTNKATFSYPNSGHSGGRAVKVQITKSGTGDAKWYFQKVSVTPGQIYLFSDYSMADIKSSIVIEYAKTNGTLQYADLGTLPASSTWQQFQKSFTIPAGITSLTVFHLINTPGSLTVDDYSLTLGTSTPNPPPPPPNFDFSISNAGSRSLKQGQSGTTSIIATLSSGATQPVSFSTSGLPSGVTAAYSSLSCTPTCTTILTLNAGISTPTGTTTITVSGTAGSLVKTTSFSLGISASTTVQPPPPPPPPPSGNIIPNSSMENASSPSATAPTGWVGEKWGTNTTTFTYLKNLGHTGSSSVKVQTTSYGSGDAKWYFNRLPVTPGDTYNFSDWYQSTVVSHVVIDFTNTDGSDYYLEVRTAPISSNWAQFSESFQVPAKAKTMTVLHLIEGVGSLTIDDLSLVKFVPKGFNRAIVTFNFDDGWEEDTLTVLPVLKNYGFHGTFLFATTFLESTPPTGPIKVSGPAALKAILVDGNEIGAHTVTHPNMTTLTPAQLTYELQHSKDYLESVVGAGIVKNFATPFGAYNDAVVNAVKLLYRSHRPTDEGFNTRENLDPYRLKVQNMQKTTTLAEFKSWVDQAVKDKSWLILIYHRVAPNNLDDFDTPQADFKPQMDIIKNAGITVETTEQALDEILPQNGL